MATQILVTNKRKRNLKILKFSIDSLDDDKKLKTLVEIQRRLIQKFKGHVGEEESVSPAELFEFVFSIHPSDVDVYQREYWWNVVKLVLRQLKKEKILFVVNKGHYLFVLKTEQELRDLNKRYDKYIKDIENMKKLAKEWVDKESWRRI